ncbi:MMPL family transporter [Corynebacterium parakroppenstedtii]|uniref:MMPL family transporter n=1 Tax=Corynebacterium parakroppenstedtii TaxID=2828363 RepID=UPI0021AEF1B5|nr:MMPL family transporter [Corynebacterium parakroppenstedtii]
MNTTPHPPGGSPHSDGDAASPASPARGSSSVGKDGTSPRQYPHQRSPRTGKLVALSVIIIAIWLGIAAFGGPQFGNLSNVATNEQSSFLPQSSESAQVQQKIKEFGDQDRLPAIVVVEQSDGKPLDISALGPVTQQLRDAAGGDDSASPFIPSDDKTAAQMVVLLPSNSNPTDAVEDLTSTLKSDLPSDVKGWVTGPAGYTADLSDAFSGIDGLLLLVTVAAVLVILVAVYRSPFLPFLVLLGSMIALVAAVGVNVALASSGIVMINGQIQGILFILVIGAATDYGLLYTARYREELRKLPSSGTRLGSAWQATRAAWLGSWRPILASAGTVSAGLLCLLFSDLASNSGLGPVAAVGIGCAMIVSLTFLPAVLFLTGSRVFWPRVPTPSEGDADAASPVWSWVAKTVSRRPWQLAVGVSVVLAAGCVGVATLHADGVPQSEFVLGDSQARDGQTVLDEHFPGGSGSPAYVVVPEEKMPSTARIIQNTTGVESVSVSSTDSPSGSPPLSPDGTVQTGTGDSGAGSQPGQSGSPTVVDGDVLLSATLTSPVYSDDAQQTVTTLRHELKGMDAEVGGTTAINVDTNATSVHDRKVIVPIVLALITILLAALLRSLVAPLVLVLCTVLSYGAALGVASLLFTAVGLDRADPTVPLYGFIFLVALAIDYTIFLMTRVREEAPAVGTRKGMRRSLVSTGGVITSAGLVLAATFAALFVIPIQFLVQLAIIISLGVLIDTFIVRTFLVPSIVELIGRRVWWPSRLSRKSGNTATDTSA